MEKEVKPNPIPKIKKPIPKQTKLTTQDSGLRTFSSAKQNVKYKYAGKEKLSEILGKSIPRQLIPTKRMGEIFGYIFLAVLIIAALTFPYGSLLSGSADISLKIGVPFTFLELNATATDELPIKLTGLILDLLIYLFLSYAIEVIINLMLKNPLLKSKEDRKKHPTIFKNKKAPTIADQITKKIIQKTQPNRQQLKANSSPKSPVASPKSKTIKVYNSSSTPSTNQSGQQAQPPRKNQTSPQH